MRLKWFGLPVAVAVCMPTVTKAQEAEQLSAIAAALQHEVINLRGRSIAPCVKSEVKESTDVEHQEVVLDIPPSSIPASLKLCSKGVSTSRYQVYLPDLYGDGATVSLVEICAGGV
jgi:hypothetical protein